MPRLDRNSLDSVATCPKNGNNQIRHDSTEASGGLRRKEGVVWQAAARGSLDHGELGGAALRFSRKSMRLFNLTRSGASIGDHVSTAASSPKRKHTSLTSRGSSTPATSSSSTSLLQPHLDHELMLPEGMFHVWIYQARQLAFRRLFEPMYERHGLRLRVHVTSRISGDVSETHETRRNFAGTMANPRWRRDKDDARDHAKGHFCIPFVRETLRVEPELIVEIVCGILVVGQVKVPLISLLLGSFGTTTEHLATQSVQFRPHWFALSGDDRGVIEMALEFIPSRIVEELEVSPMTNYSQLVRDNQPESEYESSDDASSIESRLRDAFAAFSMQPEHLQSAGALSVSDLRSLSPTSAKNSRHRVEELETYERYQNQRQGPFDPRSNQYGHLPAQSRFQAGTPPRNSFYEAQFDPMMVSQASSSLVSSQASSPAPRLQLPSRMPIGRRHSMGAPQLDVLDMDAYASTRNLYPDNYEEEEDDESVDTDYDDSLSSFSSSWGSASRFTTASVNSIERSLDQQLLELYRFGISDDAALELDASRSSTIDTTRKMSAYSVAFSDVSEASMVSRATSTNSEGFGYNERIQRMEAAIIAAQERRQAEAAGGAAPASSASAPRSSPAKLKQVNLTIPSKEARLMPPSPAHPMPRPVPISMTGWDEERNQHRSVASPATSEPTNSTRGGGIVLFDIDNIPVNGDGGTDPSLAAYRARMLARRRSLPVSSLYTGPSISGGRGLVLGKPTQILRDLSAPRSSSVRELISSDNQTDPVNAPNSQDATEEKAEKPKPKAKKPEAKPAAMDGMGPPPLRRNRSSSMHSISELLRDQFQIHNIDTTTETTNVTQRESNERKLTKGTSFTDSDKGSEASSTNSSQFVPTMSTSGAPPRVRRNSKGNNVVYINGVAVGVGKFINVGTVPGVIRYIGQTMFAPGLWIGIELVEKKGKHNGTVQNVQYFECADHHGIFIRAERLDISVQP
ncbi:hypothetical protein Poli38472_001282 [Pythium oligandrum]|uniref:CAP-Gly domain-containing protein n=1 Tax=Pythium oligandrum TaxID=41045 RepID=A0A8K1CSN9_PYTOL|nr:hypothetical protein Poli38472_001282 [Pythium oligandrum]|eukprot:TMW69126.1 hypothetical protein Poli38472_001282 [Pythium oligandrum]